MSAQTYDSRRKLVDLRLRLQGGSIVSRTATALPCHPTKSSPTDWVSEFAPARFQKVLSYTVGWLCVLGWQVGMASVSYTAAQQIGAMAVLTSPDTYAIKGWHLALIDWGITFVAIACNTVFFKKLPLMEGLVMVLHWFVSRAELASGGSGC